MTRTKKINRGSAFKTTGGLNQFDSQETSTLFPGTAANSEAIQTERKQKAKVDSHRRSAQYARTHVRNMRRKLFL